MGASKVPYATAEFVPPPDKPSVCASRYKPPKVAILISGSEVKISDSEVKDRFSTMRLVGLN